MTGCQVTTAAQAAARDRAAIAAGTPAVALMQRAGTAAAQLLLRDDRRRLQGGVTCWAGPGNNGGDAYVVAAELARHGVPVRVRAVAPPRSEEARAAAQAWAVAAGVGPEEEATPSLGWGGVVVDGLVGTGHTGALRGPVAAACLAIASARANGAHVVALDLPTGVDATSGALAPGHVVAHDTLSFGSVKRGALLARGAVGRLRVLDIGLGAHARQDDGAWALASPETLGGRLADVPWNAHKGDRGRVVVVGGGAGMAGAALWAAEGALRAGAGVVTALVDAASVPAVQGALPQALAAPWPPQADHLMVPSAHALAVGPGLGRGANAAALLAAVVHTLRHHQPVVPVVLDADALWHLADGQRPAAQAVAAWSAGGRPVVLTPHAGEAARLLGAPLSDDWDLRVHALQQLARDSGAVVLCKGTPTLVVAPDGAVWAMPRGTPVLATGGSGDLLAGMLATLMAQRHGALEATLLAATAHGLAAERVHQAAGGARGTLLADVSASLPHAWRLLERGVAHPEGVLVDLPALA
jgi:NAD(P)H-hydrate epimerase